MATENEILEKIYGMNVVESFPAFGPSLENKLAINQERYDNCIRAYDDVADTRSILRRRIRTSLVKVRAARAAGTSMDSSYEFHNQLLTAFQHWNKYRRIGIDLTTHRQNLVEREQRVANIKREILLRGPLEQLEGRSLQDVQEAFAQVHEMEVDALMVGSDRRNQEMSSYGILFKTGAHRIVGSGEVESTPRASYRVLVVSVPGRSGSDGWVQIKYSVADPFNMFQECSGVGEYNYLDWCQPRSKHGSYHLEDEGTLLRLGYYCNQREDDEGEDFNATPGDTGVYPAAEQYVSYSLPDDGGTVSVNYAGLPHPHILHESCPAAMTHNACVGSYESMIRKEFRSSNWLGIAIAMSDFLSSYNNDDPAGRHGYYMYYDERGTDTVQTAEPTPDVMPEPDDIQPTPVVQPAPALVPRWEPVMFLSRDEDGNREIRWASDPANEHEIRRMSISPRDSDGDEEAPYTFEGFPAVEVNTIDGVSAALNLPNLAHVSVTTTDGLYFAVDL